MNKVIDLSKLLSIEIDGENNVIRWIPNWDSEQDNVGVYSEESMAVLKTGNRRREFDVEYITVWSEDSVYEEEETQLYLVHLFDLRRKVPPGKKRRSRKRKGLWHSILFTPENFDAEIDDRNLDGGWEYNIEEIGVMTFATMKISEFLRTDDANYIRGSTSPSDPRKPRVI